MSLNSFIRKVLSLLVAGLVWGGVLILGNDRAEGAEPGEMTCTAGKDANAGEILVSHVYWTSIFKTVDELSRGVDTIVLARAVSTAPSRLVESDGGGHTLPFELVTFEVIRRVKGSALGGERISVERVGGFDASGTRVTFTADGGELELGQTYLLFLNRQNDRVFYQVNHQGRYELAGSSLRGSMGFSDPVIDELHGDRVDLVIADIERSIRK
jgi:hypothetical protein